MDNLLKDYRLTDGQLLTVCKQFCQQIKNGLSEEAHFNADIKCFPTYVQKLPNGEEIGKALTIDLGGSIFRISLVTLKGRSEADLDSKTYNLSKEKMSGAGEDLFDYIAECLHDFIKEKDLLDAKLPVGFTFSFPCRQKGLKQAILMRWTKGFSCAGAVGRDVAMMLREAAERRGDISIDILAILNDTIGALMSCGHRVPNCRIGCIVDTGCNACYWERVKKVELLEDEYKVNHNHVVVNCEWGAFGENGCLTPIQTVEDIEIDNISLNRGQQIFEKMVAGMYLGDIVRLLVVKAIQRKLMFQRFPCKEALVEKLSTKGIIDTRLLSFIEEDSIPEFEKTRALLTQSIGLDKICVEDLCKLKEICEVVTKRSAILVGLALAGLTNRVRERKIVIGIDGSIYRSHPKYDEYLRAIMNRLVHPDIQYDLMLSEDGSGRGAAILANVASREQQAAETVAQN